MASTGCQGWTATYVGATHTLEVIGTCVFSHPGKKVRLKPRPGGNEGIRRVLTLDVVVEGDSQPGEQTSSPVMYYRQAAPAPDGQSPFREVHIPSAGVVLSVDKLD
jgi:hypothetical protein